MITEADQRAYDRTQSEGFALGRWPSVYRIVRIAKTHGASPWALLARTKRLGIELDQVSGKPKELHPTGRLVSLDDTPVCYYRRAILAPDTATFEVLSLGDEPYVVVYNGAGDPIRPRDFKREANRVRPLEGLAPPPLEEVR